MKKCNIIKNVIFFLITIALLNFNIIAYAADETDGADSVIKGGQSFITAADNTTIDTKEMKKTSDLIYNTLFAIAIGVALISGAIMGIKFMMGAVEEKADIKELMKPYLIGCIVVFSSFGIWKAIIEIMKKI